jgi:hypothetical protein
LTIAGDVGLEEFCSTSVQRTLAEFHRMHVLSTTADGQHPEESIEQIRSEQLDRTFRTNLFSFFYMPERPSRTGSRLRCTTMWWGTWSLGNYSGNMVVGGLSLHF